MKGLARLAGMLVLATSCGSPVPTVPPIPGTATELGRGEQPQSYSEASDVSDSGRVVGHFGTWAAEFEGDGSVTFLPTPAGYRSCEARAVADDGVVAGDCVRDGAPDSHITDAFLWDPSRAVRPLIEPNPNETTAVVGMNNAGVVLSMSFELPDGRAPRPWIYDTRAERLTELPLLPNAHNEVRSINDAGDIVGTVIAPDGNTLIQPVKWSSGTLIITRLTSPADCGVAEALGINNHGVIVGQGCLRRANARAVIWRSASAAPEDLALPPPRLDDYSFDMSVATAVNDQGVVIGTAHYHSFDIGRRLGVAWTEDGRVVEFGNAEPVAINASGVVVGGRNFRAVRLEW